MITVLSGSTVIHSNDGGVMDNQKSENRKVAKSRATAKTEMQIIHKVFHNMMQHTDDPYWLNILRLMAGNKFHNGFAFRHNRLSHMRSQNKAIEIEVTDSTLESFMRVKTFMEFRARNISDKDKAARLEEEYRRHLKTLESNKDSTISICSKNNLRYDAIVTFVERMTEREGYTKKQSIDLTDAIKMKYLTGCKDAFTFKGHTLEQVKDIEMLSDGSFRAISQELYIPPTGSSQCTLASTLKTSITGGGKNKGGSVAGSMIIDEDDKSVSGLELFKKHITALKATISL